jgi:hypothetical protein
MTKSQALWVPPWKIVVWFPRVVNILSKIEEELKRLMEKEVSIPDGQLLPKLAKHWEQLTE